MLKLRFALPVALLLLAAWLSTGCERNVASTILTPTGERAVAATGVITGQLNFGGGAPPRSLILFARVSNASYHSAYTKIQVIGTFTGWNEGSSPHLIQLAPGAWIDTLTLPAGPISWKFRTNDDWDPTPDYGRDASQPDGLTGALANPAPGGDAGNLKATVGAGAAGPLVCTLVETPAPARYAFKAIGSAGAQAVFTSIADGSFSVSSLVPGNYNILIRTPTSERLISGINVGSGITNLGTIGTTSYTITASAGSGGSISPTGAVTVSGGSSQAFTITPEASYVIQDVAVDGTSVGAVATYTFTNVTANHTIAATFTPTGPLTGGITGTLIFDPSVDPDITAPPWPPTTLELFRGTSKVGQLTTPKSSNSYGFSNLPAGSYKIRWNAWQFTFDSLSVTVGASVINQDITLIANLSQLSSNMHCAGDFNGFTVADSTQMTLVAVGLWEYTPSHPIAAGTYFMKFVTDGFFDNPTDYGGDQTVTITAPVTDADCHLVSGTGTALKIQIPTDGIYRFRIDERRLTFSVEPVGP